MKKIKLSVVICTCNRPNLLERCLQSLERQKRAEENTEFLVIDNHPLKAAKEVVDAFIKKGSNVRYITEKHYGLSHARNRGLRQSRGENVAFIDDDAIADPDWIKNIISFIKDNPGVQVFGGPYSYYSINVLPAWFSSAQFTLNYGPKMRKLNPFKGKFLSGTNMIYSKSLLLKMGGFNVDLGMIGRKTGYGEETELQKRIGKKGIPIYYVPSIKVRHLIARHKQKPKWLLKDAFIRGVSQSNFQDEPFLQIIYSLTTNFLTCIYLFFFPKKENKKYWQRRVFFSLRPLLTEMGFIWGKITQ